MFLLFSLSFANPCLDSAYALFTRGTQDFDSIQLKNAIAKTTNCVVTAPMDRFNRELLFGSIYWRLELIAHLTENKKGVDYYGGLATVSLNNAEKIIADDYDVNIIRYYVYLVLAGNGGFKNGAFYGPRLGGVQDKLIALRPQAYPTRVIRAITTMQSPKIAGGNVDKGVLALQALTQEFPDSIEIKAQLAQGYKLQKKTELSKAEAQKVLAKNPRHLLAQKVLRDLTP